MAFLTQQRFPRLWLWFQFLAGGTVDKRRLCVLTYAGQSDVLEIGCSVGNITPVFAPFPDVQYTGLDIDPIAIQAARRRFVHEARFRFICEPLTAFCKRGETFDYILFAAILHHVDDATCAELLGAAATLARPGATIAVVEPLLPEATDPPFVRLFIHLEQGEHVRTDAGMRRVLSSQDSVILQKSEMHYIGATPFSMPKCARFGVYVLEARRT